MENNQKDDLLTMTSWTRRKGWRNVDTEASRIFHNISKWYLLFHKTAFSAWEHSGCGWNKSELKTIKDSKWESSSYHYLALPYLAKRTKEWTQIARKYSEIKSKNGYVMVFQGYRTQWCLQRCVRRRNSCLRNQLWLDWFRMYFNLSENWSHLPRPWVLKQM